MEDKKYLIMANVADHEEEAEVLKTMAMLKLREGELTPHALKRILDRLYNLGHYNGHCRGEVHVRKMFELPLTEM